MKTPDKQTIPLSKKATKNQIQLITSHKGYYYFINNN